MTRFLPLTRAWPRPLPACICLVSTVCAVWATPRTARAEAADSTLPFYVDTGVRTSRAPDSTIMIEPVFEVGRSVAPHISLGLGLTGGSAPLLGGQRSAFTVAPSIDLFHFLGPVQGYARLGLAVQNRSGGGLEPSESLAVFSALGARVNTGLCILYTPDKGGRGCLSAGTEIRLQNSVTSGWLMYPAVLPKGASILSTGFFLGVEA